MASSKRSSSVSASDGEVEIRMLEALGKDVMKDEIAERKAEEAASKAVRELLIKREEGAAEEARIDALSAAKQTIANFDAIQSKKALDVEKKRELELELQRELQPEVVKRESAERRSIEAEASKRRAEAERLRKLADAEAEFERARAAKALAEATKTEMEWVGKAAKGFLGVTGGSDFIAMKSPVERVERRVELSSGAAGKINAASPLGARLNERRPVGGFGSASVSAPVPRSSGVGSVRWGSGGMASRSSAPVSSGPVSGSSGLPVGAIGRSYTSVGVLDEYYAPQGALDSYSGYPAKYLFVVNNVPDRFVSSQSYKRGKEEAAAGVLPPIERDMSGASRYLEGRFREASGAAAGGMQERPSEGRLSSRWSGASAGMAAAPAIASINAVRPRAAVPSVEVRPSIMNRAFGGLASWGGPRIVRQGLEARRPLVAAPGFNRLERVASVTGRLGGLVGGAAVGVARGLSDFVKGGGGRGRRRGQAGIIGLIMTFVSLVVFVNLLPAIIQVIQVGQNSTSDVGSRVMLGLLPLMFIIGIVLSYLAYLAPTRER